MNSEHFNTACSFLSTSTKDSIDIEDGSESKENIFLKDLIKFEIHCDFTFLKKKIKKFLSKIIKENKEKSSNQANFSLFLINDISKINLKEYLKRLCNYLEVESSTLILALIYLERIFKKGFILNEFSKYKLLLVSLILAVKFNEDDFPTNFFFAKVGGIKLEELNFLEAIFLQEIEYNLWVREEEFESFYFDLISEKKIY